MTKSKNKYVCGKEIRIIIMQFASFHMFRDASLLAENVIKHK